MIKHKLICCILFFLIISLRNSYGQDEEQNKLSKFELVSPPPNGSISKDINIENKSIHIQENNTSMSFNDIDFNNKLSIKNSALTSYLHLIGCNFKNEVDFFSTNFKEEFRESSCLFYKSFSLNICKFEKFAFFESNIFQDNVTFVGTIFNDGLILKNSTFIKEVYFNNVHFTNFLDLSGSTFEENIDFNGVELPLILTIENTEFKKIDFRFTFANFKSTSIDLLNPNTLMGDLFSGKDYKYYEQAKELKKCIIRLKGATIQNLILPYNLFVVDTAMYNFNDKFFLYSKLIKNCEEVGLMDSVEGWSIELEKAKNINNYGNFFGGIWNRIQYSWWGFGFQRVKIVYWTFVFFIIFVLFNAVILENLLYKVYFDPDIGKNFRSNDISNSKQLIHSLNTNKWYKTLINRIPYSLHYTGIIYFGLKVNHEAINFRSLGVVYFYLIYLTGILHLAGIVTFILQVNLI